MGVNQDRAHQTRLVCNEYTMRAGRRFVFFLPIAAGLLLGQGKAPQWASISGIVQDDATGKPIANATVTLATTGSDAEEAVARTDINGAFGFAYVPSGKYFLHVANDDRYQGVWFGAEAGDRPAAPMDLHAGEARAGIALRLKPLGSISGVVTDTAGHPIEHAQVVILQRTFLRGKPRWLDGRRAQTDEQGRYRIEPVFPGKHVLRASAQYQRPAALRSEATYGDPASSTPQAYGEQLYPRGTLDNVAPFDFAPGQRLEGIDFQLPAEAAVDVRIKINAPEAGVRFANVQMIRRDGTDRMSFGVPMEADNFHIQLGAGGYTAVATAQGESKTWRSITEVDVSPSTTELALDLSPGIDLAGRVTFEGDAKQRPRFHVRLVPGERLPISAPTAAADADGKFLIHGVAPGIWEINVSPVPRGGYIKSMLLGDYDVLTNEMVIAGDTAAPLNIVVSARGAAVTGTIAEDAASHSSRAVVLLAPDGKYAHVLSFYRVASSGDDGKFEFKSVMPGRYKLYAFDRMEPGSWQDPDFLKPYQEHGGETLSVAEGETIKRESVVLLHVKEEAR